MTDREAMQAALDALLPHKSTITRAYTPVDAAIDALRTALDQPESDEVLAEREDCAQVCDGWTNANGDRCAETIRARGQE